MIQVCEELGFKMENQPDFTTKVELELR